MQGKTENKYAMQPKYKQNPAIHPWRMIEKNTECNRRENSQITGKCKIRETESINSQQMVYQLQEYYVLNRKSKTKSTMILLRDRMKIYTAKGQHIQQTTTFNTDPER